MTSCDWSSNDCRHAFNKHCWGVCLRLNLIQFRGVYLFTGNKLPLSDFLAYEEMMLDVMCEIGDPDDKLRLIVKWLPPCLQSTFFLFPLAIPCINCWGVCLRVRIQGMFRGEFDLVQGCILFQNIKWNPDDKLRLIVEWLPPCLQSTFFLFPLIILCINCWGVCLGVHSIFRVYSGVNLF